MGEKSPGKEGTADLWCHEATAKVFVAASLLLGDLALAATSKRQSQHLRASVDDSPSIGTDGDAHTTANVDGNPFQSVEAAHST